MLLLAQGPSGHAAAPGLSRAPPHPAWPPGPQPLRGSQLRGTAGHDHPAHSPAAFIGSGGRAGKDGGLAVATSGHRSIHRDDTALPSCHCAVERGWMVAGAEGLFLLWLMSLLLHAGRFALALQAGRSLPGAGSVSHHDLSKKPCSGIFKPPPVRGGEWEEAQLLSHHEVLQMLVLEFFSRPLPLPTSGTPWDLALAPHKSLGHS